MSRGKYLDKFLLSGQVALITGASRGIGREIALGFAEAGADIVLASRKLPDLEAVAKEITAVGRKALPVAANIRNIDEVMSLVKKAVEEFGRIDILVNNAATNPVFGSVFKMDERAWETTIGLNLKGYFFLSQAVGRMMKEKGGGRIINIASIDGIRPRLGASLYAISKAGVIMLTQALAQEWGRYNIRVNSIAPGVVRTRFSEALVNNPTIHASTLDSTALGRIAEAEEIVGAALFLASEASSYLTGQTIVIDGGHFAYVQTLAKDLPA